MNPASYFCLHPAEIPSQAFKNTNGSQESPLAREGECRGPLVLTTRNMTKRHPPSGRNHPVTCLQPPVVFHRFGCYKGQLHSPQIGVLKIHQ